MRFSSAIVIAALTLGLALPLAAVSQPAPPPPPEAHARGMNSLMRDLNLTAAQKQKIQALVQAYHSAHPRGSAPDPQARQALHEQILAVLTPAQQAQFKAYLAAMPMGEGPGHARGMMGRLSALNLSDQQKAQIQTLVQNYRKAHPEGSAPDPKSMQALHDQIFGLLTPAQQAQYNAQEAQLKANPGAPPGARPGGMMGRFRALNLSEQQRQQIRAIISQYRASHPDADMRDPATRQALQAQIFTVLTPAQQQQWNEMLKAEGQGNNP